MKATKHRIGVHTALLFVIMATTASAAENTTEGPDALSIERHLVVLSEPDHFAGWPANNGLWNWDNGKEILVGCTLGSFKEQTGHNIAPPFRSVLLRSTDAGEHWTTEDPAHFVGDGDPVLDSPGGIDFAHPDLALRCVGSAYHGSEDKRGAFFVSTNRGRAWRGPFRFNGLNAVPEQADREQTPRTDYQAIDAKSCWFFLSSRPVGGVTTDDRVYVARTDDGGASFRQVAWMVPPSDPFRAVMPSTVLVGRDDLLSAVRRRTVDDRRCWIDAWFSRDGGLTWTLRSEVGDTGGFNGNPPALLKLRDGRLLCAYGNRSTRRMVVRLSADRGATWSVEQPIRQDYHTDRFKDSDFGYPRLVQRPDDSVIAFYYFASKEHPVAHIAATVLRVPRTP